MSQCWCYTCAGGIVTRKTFVNHGRKDKPDERVRVVPDLPMVSMPDLPDERKVHLTDDEDTDEDTDDPFDDPLGLAVDEDPQRTGKAQLSSAEVTLFLLDWMCTHKVNHICRHNRFSIDIICICQHIQLVSMFYVICMTSFVNAGD